MIRLRAVGECCIEVGAERVGPESELAFAVLLVVVLAQGRPVPRRQLVDLLWPATSERRARHNLRQALYKLRQVGVPLCAEPHDVRVPAGVVRMDQLLEMDPDAAAPAELLRPDIPFGEFLAGYRPSFSDAFGRWLEDQREAMHGRLRRVVLGALLDERRRGNWGAVETLARKALQLDPLNEEATLGLAEATALTGSKRAAIAILDGYLQELGADEETELRLPASILRRRIADRLQHTTTPDDTDTCFVGRAESMAVLTHHFQRVRQGIGQALLVWGERGIGKSRLVAEFGGLAILDGAQVVRIACQARDADRPLAIWVDGVPELLRLPGAIGCSPESMRYLKRLTDHDPDMLEPTTATREAELLFAGVRRAILDLLDAVAGESPVVLLVEDAQWLDPRSWRVLREVIEWVDSRALFVILTSRVAHVTPRMSGRGAIGLASHQLRGLDQHTSRVLLAAITGKREPPQSFIDWSIEVADGNPFHLRSLGFHWVETGQMRAPASLTSLVIERLQRLPELPLRTLQACAVLARNSTLDRLQRVLQYRHHALINALALLETEGLLVTRESASLCKHALIQEGALALLPPATRRLLHRYAAGVLQADIERVQQATLLWDCAQQWHAAGEGDRALKLVRSCAAHLLEIGLPLDAAEVLEQAIELCEDDHDVLEIKDKLAYALYLSGKWERLKAVIYECREMRARFDSLADRHCSQELLLFEAQWRTDRNLDELLAEATWCSEDVNAPSLHRLSAASTALVFADNLCDARAAARIYDCVSSLLKDDSLDACARLRIEVIYNAVYGDLDTAITATDEWIRTERATADPARLARALRNAATPFRLAGLSDKAFGALLEAHELSARLQLASSAANSADILATMNIARGDLDSARRWYERATHWLSQLEESASTVSIRRIGARIALESGDPHAARQLLGMWNEKLSEDPVVRRRVEAFALHTHCLLLESGERIPDRLLSDYWSHYSRARSLGNQDYSTEILALALCRQGRNGDAVTAIREYASMFRRERGSVPERIQAAITQM